MGRIRWLLVAAVTTGACASSASPAPTVTPSSRPLAESPSVASSAEPRAAPRSTPPNVRALRHSEGEYERKGWVHWIDEDQDCQDTRAEVLIRDSEVPVTMDAEGCDVVTGRWTCPYSLEVFEDPAALDIDHVVPLKHAFEHGAQAWTAEQRRDYANALDDPRHLVAASSHANRSKGAKGIERWLPDRVEQRCEYVARWLSITRTWNLEMTPSEEAIAARFTRLCTREVELPAPQHTEDLEHAITSREDPAWAGDEVDGAACCRVCRKGKPCGDSCIARRETCRRPVGCACGS